MQDIKNLLVFSNTYHGIDGSSNHAKHAPLSNIGLVHLKRWRTKLSLEDEFAMNFKQCNAHLFTIITCLKQLIGVILFLINLNPILHGGGHFVPAHVDYPSWFLGGCPKWAHISWLCFINHFIGPMESIFQKQNWEFWKTEKKNFYVPTPKGPPFGKKTPEKLKILIFSMTIKLFTPESEFYMF